MKSSFEKKSLAFAIIVLFFGISIAPSISGSVRELNNETYADDIIVRNYKIMEDFNSSPLFFTENQGQFLDDVLFQTHVQDATVYLCQNKLVSVFTQEQEENQIDARDNNQIHLNHRRLKEPRQLEMISIVTEFVGANPNTVAIGEHPLPHKNNYFIGNNPAQWYTNISNYNSIVYQDIYPRIDLIYYGANGLLKYDFIVHAGADPAQIAIHYKGAENIQMTPGGDLMITTRLGSIYEKHPVIYQEIGGVHQQVAGSYLLERNDSFSFVVEGFYNQEYPLIIDPGLVYSTYLGGSKMDFSMSNTVDSSGCVYVTGQTNSHDFPAVNPYDGIYNGYYDTCITKFSPQGNTLVYSTYLGGSHAESGGDIAVDVSGCVYVTGFTYSSDFPTVNPYDSTLGPDVDVFVSKISSSGNSLVYSTYLGGDIGMWDGVDFGTGIAVDSSGCTYVTGYTSCTDFPVQSPYDDTFNGGGCDVFLTKFSPQGNTLEYSTFLGGSLPDDCWGIDIDNNGCAYITGITYSEDFPMQNSYDDSYNGEEDAYITKFSPQGNTLEYSTFLGGMHEEWGGDIAVDSNGRAYAVGLTGSRDFPTVNSYDDTYNGGYSDVYVTKLSPGGNTLEYSTYIGGNNYDGGFSVAVDSDGSAYITGTTESNNFPVVNSYDGTYNGNNDVFVTKVSSKGNSLGYSTYLGGSEYEFSNNIYVDNGGCTHVFGYTCSFDFPVVNPYDDTYNGNGDLFLTKFPEGGGSNGPNTPQRPLGSTNGKAGQQYTYTAVTTDPQDDNIYYLFDWGDSNGSGWVGPYISSEPGSASYTWDRGNYNIRVKAKDVNGDVSGWSEPLSITMPKNKIINPFERFLENHPYMFPLLRQLLGL